MEPDAAEQVFFHGHPSWRSMVSFHLKGFVAAVVVGAIAGLVAAAIEGKVRVIWVIAGVLSAFAVALVVGVIKRRRTTYTISDQRLTIELGIVSKEVHETRIERVQNVSLRQSLLERALGVGTVDFDTAGGASFDFSFKGVSRPRQIVRTVDRALRGAVSAGPAHSPDGL